MENFTYYIFALIVLIIGFLIFKKVATCLIKAIITVVVLAVLGIAYWLYLG